MKQIFLLVLMLSMFEGAVYADECISGDCQNGKVSKKYAYRLEYVGDWKDDASNRQRILTYPYGRKEIGQFKDGVFIGR
ncbi:MAG TPA: hypothetical protein P5509_12200 [Bacteroidales bacterium]|nr:hypothetical protein [Bacteroidales bacterium]